MYWEEQAHILIALERDEVRKGGVPWVWGDRELSLALLRCRPEEISYFVRMCQWRLEWNRR